MEHPSCPLGRPRRSRCTAHPGYPIAAQLGSRPKHILSSDCALDSCIRMPAPPPPPLLDFSTSVLSFPAFHPNFCFSLLLIRRFLSLLFFQRLGCTAST